MPQPLLLADTPHLLYRAFFALPDSITDADGRPVNALLGSVNQLLWCVERYEPRAVVCCFGQESATYRTELYPPYHAHRPEMPADLAHQWEQAPALYEALGWTVTAHDALEADDLMHAYATREVEAGGRAQILTGDRDMFQCARDGITILLQRARQEGPDEMGAGRGRGALRDPAGDRAGLHRAARRPVRRAARARRGSARRRRPTCCAATAASRRRSRERSARSRRSAARCSSRPTSCARSRTSRRSATPTWSAHRTARPTAPAARPRRARWGWERSRDASTASSRHRVCT